MSDAAIAFWFHAPGLRILRGYRMPTPLFLLNAAAIAITFVCAGLSLRYSHPAVAIACWLTGHFGWSVYLAFTVSRAPLPRR